MNQEKLYQALIYAGTLPFVGVAILSLLGIETLAFLGATKVIAYAYALAIVSFIAGTHWGQYLVLEGQIKLNLFVISNVVTVVVWIGFLVGMQFFGIVAAVGFVALVGVDFKMIEYNAITKLYLKTRIQATIITVLALGIIDLV